MFFGSNTTIVLHWKCVCIWGGGVAIMHHSHFLSLAGLEGIVHFLYAYTLLSNWRENAAPLWMLDGCGVHK